MSNFIVIGDPHFQQTNIVEVDLFIDRLLTLVRNRSVDYIVVLGDVLHFHERVHTTPLNKAYELVKKLRERAPVYILVGNHDYTSNQAFLTEDHWMNAMKEWKNVIIVDKVVELIDDYNQVFLFVPYVPPGRFIEALKTHPTDYKKATAIFAHQEFQGCKMGMIVSTEGDTWHESLPPVISGHIHSKQTIKNIYYTGSAMQHAFGESEKNIIAYMTFEDKKFTLEENDLDLPRKKIVYKSLDEIEDYDPSKKSKDHIKLTLSGTQEEFKAFKKTKKYKEIVDSGAKMVFKSKKIDAGNEEVKDEYDFGIVLDKLIDIEKNPYLREVYEKVVHDRTIKADSIIYI
jgi:DNA repair exonuclease SbcCD nuclease subunit